MSDTVPTVADVPPIPETNITPESMLRTILALRVAVETLLGRRSGLAAGLQPNDSTPSAWFTPLTPEEAVVVENLVTSVAGKIGDVVLDFSDIGGVVPSTKGGTGQNTLLLSIQSLLAALSTTHGALLLRAATGWAALNPSTAGRVLKTAGAGANPFWADSTYDIALYAAGPVAASETLLRFVCARAFTIPAGTAGAASVVTPPTLDVTMTLRKNGVTFGTVYWPVGAPNGTVNVPTPTAFAWGDILTIVAQPFLDATLADVSITLLANKA